MLQCGKRIRLLEAMINAASFFLTKFLKTCRHFNVCLSLNWKILIDSKKSWLAFQERGFFKVMLHVIYRLIMLHMFILFIRKQLFSYSNIGKCLMLKVSLLQKSTNLLVNISWCWTQNHTPWTSSTNKGRILPKMKI